MPTRVMIVMDRTLFRELLVGTISERPEAQVVGAVANRYEAVVRSRDARPDVVLFEVGQDISSGLEFVRELHREVPEAAVVFLSDSDSAEHALEAIRAGARGFLPKNVDTSELLSVLKVASSGRIAVADNYADQLAQQSSRQHLSRGATEDRGPLDLTPREKSVLALLGRGKTNKEIAAALSISPNTARSHLRNLMLKLGVNNRIQLALIASREGLVGNGN